ncbi:MAG: SEL1-like repeat protein [Verrucomicrobiota bacterium]
MLPLAAYNLGNHYADGQGVAKDAAEAVIWFRKAAEQGHSQRTIQSGQLLRQRRGSRGGCWQKR